MLKDTEVIESENKESENKESGIKTPGIEELFNELEETIQKLNNGDISLEQSFALYERGMKLAAKCEKEIDTVEKKVLELSERGTVSEFT